MHNKILINCLLVLGLSIASSANAKNSQRYSWWGNVDDRNQSCHSHNNNYSRHYYWSRFLPWHHHCPNEKPEANAGADQNVNVNDVVTLDGTASSDSDGTIRRYSWSQKSGPRVRLRSRRSATPTFTAPLVTEATDVMFVLVVKDNAGQRDRDPITVTITPVTTTSELPVADAGADQIVDEEMTVMLDASASSDPDNDIAEYLWQQTTGTTVSLNDATTATASFTAPELDVAETLEFSVTVTDSQANTASDTVSVTVEPVIPVSQANVRIRTLDASLVSSVTLRFYVDGVLRDDLTAAVDGTGTLTIDADTNYSIRTDVDGYAVQIVPFRSAAEGSHVDLDITLIPRGDEITISGAGSFSEEGRDGAAVSFTTSDFVDAEGNPVLGDIQLSITPVDVSQPATLAAFPGEFTGVLEGSGEETPIISLGTVEFEFTANGESINLADGATADILIPIYNFTYQDGSNIAVGDVIPLWSLDEGTGIWDQEGTGTVVASIDSPTGLSLSATVSHFSWWNCDVSMNAARVEVTVLGADNGTATVFGRTESYIGFRPSLVDTTIPVNATTNPLFIPSSAQTCLWAEVNFDSGSTVTTPEQCVTPTPSALLQLTFGTGSTEPLDILASPGDAMDVVTINDFITSPVDPVILSPVSIESQVTYSIASGALPAGLSLTIVNATQAELSGIATEAGSFSVVILATDDESNTDEITIIIDISSDVEPPLLIRGSQFFPSQGIFTIDLNEYNDGGLAANWAIENELPAWLTFNNNTGILRVDPSQFTGGVPIDDFPNDNFPTDSNDFEFGSFSSEVRATNSSGSSESFIFIDFFGGEGIGFNISGLFTES